MDCPKPYSAALLLILIIGVIVYVLLYNIRKTSDIIVYILCCIVCDTDSEEFVSPKGQWKRIASEVVSVAKVRQQYQAAREWYARQNRKYQVLGFGKASS